MPAPEKPPGSARAALARLAAHAPKRLLFVLRDLGPLMGLLIVVGVYYVFVVSAGHFTSWHVWSAFYDAQADGLLHGHLYLPEAPSRALMALKNPFDLDHMPFWRWDHSYYRGHLYLLLGPGAGVHRRGGQDGVSRRRRPRRVAGVRLLHAPAGGRHSADPRGRAPLRARARARWAVALAMLVFALANPTPYTLARGAIYEAAIVGGVAFMLAGLYLGYRGARRAHRPAPRSAGSRRPASASGSRPVAPELLSDRSACSSP